MSQTVLANALYIVLVLGSLVLEHFSVVPMGTTNYVIAAVAGSAATTGTLKVSTGAKVALKGQTVPSSSSQGTSLPASSPVNDLGSQG